MSCKMIYIACKKNKIEFIEYTNIDALLNDYRNGIINKTFIECQYNEYEMNCQTYVISHNKPKKLNIKTKVHERPSKLVALTILNTIHNNLTEMMQRIIWEYSIDADYLIPNDINLYKENNLVSEALSIIFDTKELTINNIKQATMKYDIDTLNNILIMLYDISTERKGITKSDIKEVLNIIKHNSKVLQASVKYDDTLKSNLSELIVPKKKVIKSFVVRWLMAYMNVTNMNSNVYIEELLQTIEAELNRDKNDEVPCEYMLKDKKISGVVNNRRFRVGLIVKKNAIIRIFKNDVWSLKDEKSGKLYKTRKPAPWAPRNHETFAHPLYKGIIIYKNKNKFKSTVPKQRRKEIYDLLRLVIEKYNVPIYRFDKNGNAIAFTSLRELKEWMHV